MSKKIKPTLVRERFFPFECSKSYGVDDEYQNLHWHKEIEICYIHEGMGNYLINGREYTFSPGDIFMIGNDDIHLCHNDKDLVMQVVMFDPDFLRSGHGTTFDYDHLRPFLESAEEFPRKIENSDTVTPRLVELLSEMEREYTEMQKGYELIIKALLLQFFGLMIRHCLDQEFSGDEKKISHKAAKKIMGIIAYLEENYADEISLGSLSEMFQMSVPYMCSTFKRFTGSSPIDYLIKRRIFMAKTMLISTESSVIAISKDCGFESLSNFNHLFKELTGISPTEYRKTIKNSQGSNRFVES